MSSYGVALRVSPFERKPVAGAREVRPNHAAAQFGRAVEQHVLDPNVVMEPFLVPQARNRAGRVEVDRRAAMAREVNMVRLTERGGLQEGGDAPAARDVDLL